MTRATNILTYGLSQFNSWRTPSRISERRLYNEPAVRIISEAIVVLEAPSSLI